MRTSPIPTMHTRNFNTDLRAVRREKAFFVDLQGSSKASRAWGPKTPSREVKSGTIDPGRAARKREIRKDKGNRFAVLADTVDLEDMPCRLSSKLVNKARRIVKLLAVDCDLVAVRPLPQEILCGSLRRAIRSIYPPELTLAQELSIKTSQKCERNVCAPCEARQGDVVGKWMERRLQPADVGEPDLQRFGVAFGGNVPRGWNLRKTAYVPNGHACLGVSRCHGGNWNRDSYSEECEVQMVLSSGKPRTVTLYSEHNVRVLTPLHNSLYTFLRKKDWLLTGAPTGDRLRQSFSEMTGREWLSFDYESATDNIKTAYVRRAVEILIEKAEDLSEDEKRCLRTMATLPIGESFAETCQPMGSPMSFPLLCLINKAVVDLALTRLMLRKEIEFKEWTRHRCLINGDDLLTKDTSSGTLAAAIEEEGRLVGLVTNTEKTLRSVDTAEINSTVFVDGVLQKKTNVSALWMSAEVEDVIGFASESCRTSEAIVSVVANNHTRLARAGKKVSGRHTWDVKKALLRSKPVRVALVSRAVGFMPPLANLFPVEPKPVGFALSREEEVATIGREVERIRAQESWRAAKAKNAAAAGLRRQMKTVCDKGPRYSRAARALRWKQGPEVEETLSCLVRAWHEKKYEELLAVDPWEECTSPPSDFSGIGRMLDLIKRFKDQRNVDRPIPLPFGVSDGESLGYVSLSDG
uniref:RNA-dependent RNA polymerase n=1 Tax=Erysiphe necator associated ourmia-like virus 21 TaxID=2741801 RepID=A0A8E3YJ25_9VIRU|nr:RNA-dependent RNA polymerase [Erysiphe necator associated ourmia-like virus 21]